MWALSNGIHGFSRRLALSSFGAIRYCEGTLNRANKFEEQYMPHYDEYVYYPVRIGDVFQDRYKVLSKLGFGANSTVWFCRDLR